MEILYDAVIALLAASGLFSLIWLLAGHLPLRGKPEKLTAVVIPAERDRLAECLWPFLWMRFWGVRDLRILVPEDSLTPCQREEAALLAERGLGLSIVKLNELGGPASRCP